MSMPLQSNKVVVAVHPQSVTYGATVTSKTVDALHAGCVSIFLSAAGATTSAVPIQIRVQHADTDAATSYASITGYTANTSSSGYPSAIQSTAATSTTVFGAFHLDMRGKKRYVRVLVDGPATDSCLISAVAVVSRNSPSQSGTNTGAAFVVVPS